MGLRRTRSKGALLEAKLGKKVRTGVPHFLTGDEQGKAKDSKQGEVFLPCKC